MIPQEIIRKKRNKKNLTEEEVNFRLWVSDEPNDIDDFDELWVTITQVGVQQGGESGVWIEHYLDPEE